MAKMVFFSPLEEITDQARRVMERLDIRDVEIRLVSSSNAVSQARKAAEDGAEIIIARGNHASLIKRYTNIPVVEIVLTAQEMGLVITKAKELLKKENPIIAVIGFSNMFCDMSHFDEIFGIRLRTYLVKYTEELRNAVTQAVRDGVDLIIGGEIVMGYAEDYGIPSLFFTSTEDSIQQALHIAFRVAYASDLEKKNSAELKTLLDYSFNAIIRLNASGSVVLLNQIAETLLQKSANEVIGRPIVELFPSLEQHHLDQVLYQGEDIISFFTAVNGIEVTVNIAPIKVENHVTGAILSCHEIRKINELETEARRKLYIHGRIPKYTFDWLEKNTSFEADFIKVAKQYALSDAPLHIRIDSCTDADPIAQSIHNASLRSGGPYVSARCSAYMAENQLVYLFGSGGDNEIKGVIEEAHHGTLFIDEVADLEPCSQYRLLVLITENVLLRDNDNRPLPVNIRVITATQKNLWLMAEEGKFRKDLYYAITTLTLTPVPLRERREDLIRFAQYHIENYCKLYSRYIKLTRGAIERIAEYPWEGNEHQLKNFCEKLVLSSTRRSVDEVQVDQLLNESYPVVLRRRPEKPIVVYKDPEAAHIAELLEKHNGNRTMVAKEMNISTTTLWRKIKKHQINTKYTV
jgi:PAS domain S-box-containing protein